MPSSKGFTLIELIVVVALIGIIGSVLLGGGIFKSDAERHGDCMNESVYIIEEDRTQFCIDKIREEDHNRAIQMSGDY